MFNILLSYCTAAVTLGIALMVIFRDPRSFVHRVFAGGMLIFAVNILLYVYAIQASTPETFLIRTWVQFVALSLAPVCWVLFSLTFARADYEEQLGKWKWALVTILVLPLAVAVLFKRAFFTDQMIVMDSSVLFIRIGWSGYVWHLIWIISSVMILMNLERTFRQTTGHLRWQTKFMFLGVGSIFGVLLFGSSQTVLFKGINTNLNVVDLGALLLADIIILRSLFRGKPLAAKMHLSHQFIHVSFTALVVGIYFFAVGIMAWLSLHFEWIKNIHIAIFLIFVAILGIAVLLLSDRLRMKRKRFISRHFKRPLYDYQKIWETFTQRTISIMQSTGLCETTVKMISETLEILAVTIWIIDEERETLVFGASTVLTDEQASNLKLTGANKSDLIEAVAGQNMPIDLDEHDESWADALKNQYDQEETKESQVRYCVPLNAAGRLVGIMTLSSKVFYEPLSFEDLELVRSIADQAAAGLLNIRLSEKLRQMKELEAFQAMSAFFIHDLKNLASKLSLVAQNLPLHLDNPEFRSDAIKTMGQSVDKINGISRRLSLLSEKLDLKLRDTDLTDFIKSTLTSLNGIFTKTVRENLEAAPAVRLDPEEMRKVLENLLLNAMDAVDKTGEIVITTGLKEKWAMFSVADNGCGIKKEFMERELFRPFRTTKNKGMGIGLFHCKTIVEAHGGKIEVESEEGHGTTFRVLLPMKSG